MRTTDDCAECGNVLQNTWIVCPFCGADKTNILASSISITELAQKSACTGCNKNCSSKGLKEKCCGKFKKKSKYCKRCPIAKSKIGSSVI